MLLLLLLFYIYYALLTRLCVPNLIMVPSISVFVAQPHFQYSRSMVLCAEPQVGALASLLCRATTSLVFTEHGFMRGTPGWCPSITVKSRNHITGIQGAWFHAQNPRSVPQHQCFCRATTLFHTLFFFFFFFFFLIFFILLKDWVF